MSEKLTDEQISGALAALDEAMAAGPWGTSPFLTLIGKKLQTIRDDFLRQQQTANSDTNETSTEMSDRLALRANMIKVYVALYANDGGTLDSWERVILNLSSHLTSRPIYTNEDDVKALIRSKPNPVNDSYASFYINPEHIIPQPPEKTLTDKLGKPLTILKHDAISLHNLDSFVHQTGVFIWKNNRLIPSAVTSQ